MSRVIHQWKKLSLVEENVDLPGRGNIVHTSVKHPGATVILPLFEDGKILLLRQFRPSLNDWIYELPAGTMESGESPLTCAMRELEEETGYSAEIFTSMGELIPVAGFCDEVQYLFRATSLRKTERLECDDDEVIEVHVLSLSEIEQMIADGSINDAKTVATIAKARLTGLI